MSFNHVQLKFGVVGAAYHSRTVSTTIFMQEAHRATCTSDLLSRLKKKNENDLFLTHPQGSNFGLNLELADQKC